MIHRILIASLFLAISPAFAASDPHQTVERHRQALAQHDYAKALLELNKTLRTAQNLSEEQKLAILVAKAEFYQRYVADLDRSLLTLEQVDLQIPTLEPVQRSDLDKRIEALQKIISAHQDEKSFIDQFLVLSAQPKIAMIDEIQARIERAGSSPYLGALTHCLGVAYFEAKQYHAAHNAFYRAMESTPAIYFSYPTQELKEESLTLWKQQLLTSIGTLTVSIFLALIMLGLFLTRPWRWVRWRHLLPLPILLVFWTIAHRLLIVLSTRLADTTVSKGDHAVLNTHSGAVLSGPLTVHLFTYGAIAVVAVFLASLAISRIELPMTRYMANACAAFCITGALMMCFVEDHGQTDFALGQSSRFKYMLGSFRYESKDPIPYVLSSPKDFPGLAIQQLDEIAQKEYLQQMEYVDRTGDE